MDPSFSCSTARIVTGSSVWLATFGTTGAVAGALSEIMLSGTMLSETMIVEAMAGGGVWLVTIPGARSR
jgi:hypothetical protein